MNASLLLGDCLGMFMVLAALCRSPLESPGPGVGADYLPAQCAGPLVAVMIGAQSELAQ